MDIQDGVSVEELMQSARNNELFHAWRPVRVC
jgi:hypothetical protein